jgi:hypothetical protein
VIALPEGVVNPFNAELNPICHLLALLGDETVVVVSRLRVNALDHGYTNFPNIWKPLKILASTCVTRSQFHTEDTNINVTLYNLFAR